MVLNLRLVPSICLMLKWREKPNIDTKQSFLRLQLMLNMFYINIMLSVDKIYIEGAVIISQEFQSLLYLN